MKKRLIDWLVFPYFAISFVLILIISDLLERIMFFARGGKGLQQAVFVLTKLLVWLLRSIGTKIHFHDLPTLTPEKPYIIVSNHQSLFDIPFIYQAFSAHAPRFVAKRELAEFLPGVSFNLRNGGSAIIDRENSSQALKEILKFGKRAEKESFAATIFPEGTRARDGVMKKFRSAGLTALIRSVPDADILPLVIDGSWRLMFFKYGPVPVGQTVHIKALPLIKREEFRNAGSNEEELVSVLEDQISNNLPLIRSEYV
jgi:1-acyl-sn-glycerol-3-phosphate acyltransferase